MWGAILGAVGRAAAFTGAAEGAAGAAGARAAGAGARAAGAAAGSEGPILTGRVVGKGATSGGLAPASDTSASGVQGRLREFAWGSARTAVGQMAAQHTMSSWQSRYDNPFDTGRTR